jgi:hypothetical protein
MFKLLNSSVKDKVLKDEMIEILNNSCFIYALEQAKDEDGDSAKAHSTLSGQSPASGKTLVSEDDLLTLKLDYPLKYLAATKLQKIIDKYQYKGGDHNQSRLP